ncbi:MAG: hypothetical protein ACRC3B_03055 [Bacteroidia bacterium]
MKTESEQLKPSLRCRQKRRDKRLSKEVIECYRSGSGMNKITSGSYRTINRSKNFLHASQKESMKKMHYLRKEQTDKLNPLIRWLEKHEGKSWDKSYSKLRKQLASNSTIGQHVFDHLWGFVERNAVVVSRNEIYRKCINPHNRLASGSSYPSFYVHPGTGILCRAPHWNKIYSTHFEYIAR